MCIVILVPSADLEQQIISAEFRDKKDLKTQGRNKMKTLMLVLIPITEIHMALEAETG